MFDPTVSLSVLRGTKKKCIPELHKDTGYGSRKMSQIKGNSPDATAKHNKA